MAPRTPAPTTHAYTIFLYINHFQSFENVDCSMHARSLGPKVVRSTRISFIVSLRHACDISIVAFRIAPSWAWGGGDRGRDRTPQSPNQDFTNARPEGGGGGGQSDRHRSERAVGRMVFNIQSAHCMHSVLGIGRRWRRPLRPEWLTIMFGLREKISANLHWNAAQRAE